MDRCNTMFLVHESLSSFLLVDTTRHLLVLKDDAAKSKTCYIDIYLYKRNPVHGRGFPPLWPRLASLFWEFACKKKKTHYKKQGLDYPRYAVHENSQKEVVML